MPDPRGFFHELRRRKVIQTALLYGALAWAAIEVVTTLVPVYGGGDAMVRVLVGLILLGLPVVIAVAWAFDLTPQGLERDSGPVGPAASSSDASVAGDAHVISRPPPAPATSLVGRDQELAAVAAHLTAADARVVTITGPGGTGKTRLAIAAAGRLAPEFPGGLAYVELAAVTDPAEVIPTVAAAVGVKEAETRSLAEGLVTVLADLRVLLVLDNLEQVVEAAPDLATLLGACPGLHILATSRAPLRIAAEVEFPLQPLGLPPAGVTPPLEDLDTWPAVQLFLERTRRARPGFQLDADNAEAVLGICRRLDGLPLALELAAARLRTLDPPTLLGRLEHALDVLTSGARDLPERQRTLRSTIDWSHSLLDEPEQRLFRGLAVFAGGWDHGAVAPVCFGEGPEDPALDVFESLVEKGLVRTGEAPGRFAMFETIREYAVERLAASPAAEVEALRRRHAVHFEAVTAAAYVDFRHGAQVASLERCDADGANLEEALHHLHAAAVEGDVEAARLGLRMCFNLWLYWHVRGLHLRARAWCRRFLELPTAESFPAERAGALVTASVASMTLGDVASAEEASRTADQVVAADQAELAVMVAVACGVTHLTTGDVAAAGKWLEEAVARGRRVPGSWEMGLALTFQAIAHAALGNAEAARAAVDAALAIQRPLEDYEGMGSSLGALAALEEAAGRPEEALRLYGEGFAAFHTIGDRPEEARMLDARAWTGLRLGRTGEAREQFAESLRAYEEAGSVRGIGLALLGLAATHAAEERPEQAVRIAAAAARFSEEEGVAIDYAKGTSAPSYLEEARAAVDPAELARLEAEGSKLTVREAVRLALHPADGGSAVMVAG